VSCNNYNSPRRLFMGSISINQKSIEARGECLFFRKHFFLFRLSISSVSWVFLIMVILWSTRSVLRRLMAYSDGGCCWIWFIARIWLVKKFLIYFYANFLCFQFIQVVLLAQDKIQCWKKNIWLAIITIIKELKMC
jgi:hypothetical protein